jgi:hypothetical protein
MLKNHVEGFIIKSNGEKIAELENLKVSMSKIKGREQKDDIKYIGTVRFNLNNQNINLPNKFDIVAITLDNTEKIYVRNCYNPIKLVDDEYEYKAEYNDNDVEIDEDKTERKSISNVDINIMILDKLTEISAKLDRLINIQPVVNNNTINIPEINNDIINQIIELVKRGCN